MTIVEQIRNEIPDACHQYRIKTVDIFGSLARNEETSENDIDLLIEFEEPIMEQSSKRFFGFLHFMEDHFDRKVDLLTPRSIKNPYLKKSIDKEKIRVYGC